MIYFFNIFRCFSDQWSGDWWYESTSPQICRFEVIKFNVYFLFILLFFKTFYNWNECASFRNLQWIESVPLRIISYFGTLLQTLRSRKRITSNICRCRHSNRIEMRNISLLPHIGTFVCRQSINSRPSLIYAEKRIRHHIFVIVNLFRWFS